MIEMTPISNTNPQTLHHSDHSKGLSLRSHEWNEHIADKKSIMELILSQCDKTTREEMTLGQSPKYDVMTGGLLKFIKQLYKTCTYSKDKNVFFGLSISKFTKQHIWPAPKSKNVFFGSSISIFSLNTMFGQQQESRQYSMHTQTMIVCGRTLTYVTYL